MRTLLWLDDYRDPNTNNWMIFNPLGPELVKTIWVKSYQEFKNYIIANGLPDAICFDHDLGDTLGPDEKTGMSCAKWLIDYCIDNNKKLPLYNIHSANPVGKDNINSILQSFIKYQQTI